ncbi:cadherin-like beta sandwich domain-containing protein [Paenibacillus kyungheensis]
MLSFILVLTSIGWSGNNVASAATTWTTATSNTTQPIYKVAYGNGMWVGAAEGGKVVTSTNGSTWTERTVDTATTPYAQSFLNVTYGGGKWVVVGNEGHVFTSNDGINWTNNSINTANNLSAVVYANSTYVIGANSGNIYYSSDAVTWTNTKPASDDFLGVAYGNSIFVAVGANGIAYSSPDGTTWTNRGPIAGSSSVYSVRFLNSTFYATSDGKIVTSTNGTSWNTPQTISGASGTVLYDITYSTGKYVIVGDLDGNFTNGVILASTDGTSWTTETPNSTPVLYGVASTSNQFTAVGDSGAIRTQSIAAASTNANLSALSLSAGTLSPAFASGTTSYTASVGNATASLTVTPTVADSTASVKVNGVTVTSGNASGAIPLNVGSNTITTVVTAQDGTTTKTYTITVTRAGSSNADLSALSLSAGTLSPAFASGTTNYTASVGNATTSLTVTPTVADSTASVKVNGVTVTSGNASGAIPLNVGSNTITTVVTAQNNTTKTYTITVTRSASSNANLSGLSLSTGTLSPTFASGTTSYTASVGNATTSLTVTPTIADSTASVTVNGVAVTSGNASGAITLAVGSNTITTVVTAQDGTTTKTYTITVTRAGSSNADLSALSLSAGTLSPTFASGTTSYTASVSNATTSLTVTPTVADSTASVTVNGVAVTSGNASGAIALAVGSNTITTVVTAQDGTTRTYTLTVTRKAATNNANLANILISAGTLSPAFDTTITAYNASVTATTSSIDITPTTQDINATVKINGNNISSGNTSSVNLAVGVNTVAIEVTAQDGSIKTYRIDIQRPQNANLSNLTISEGTLNPVFNTNTKSYTATVNYSSSTIQVTPTAISTPQAITVAGIEATSASPTTVALAVGSNTVPIVITMGDGSTQTYTITITRNNISDDDAVDEAYNALVIGYAAGDSASSVTQNLTLALTGTNGTIINWNSSNPSIIQNNGTVTRPSYPNPDTTITLNAVIQKNTALSIKTFTVVVKALPITDAQAVEADIQTLQVQYANGDNANSVTQNVGLAQAGSNNTVITWESSNPQRVSSAGTVTRSTYSEGDQTIRLTAQVTRGIVTDTKTFDLIIKAKSASSGSNLKGLTVNGLVLSPAFNPEINNYNMSVNNSTSTVTVTASVYDPEATITVNGKTLADAGTSDPIALSVGDNVITIIVTAQNGATQTYTITIKRDKKSDSGSGGGGSGNNDDPSTPGTTEPTTPSTPATDGFEIIVNGRQIEQIATGVLEQQNGQSVFTATVDTDKLGNLLANEGNAPQVIIPVKASADKVNTVLTGEAVQILAGAQATLRIETVLGNYTLPSTQLRIQQLAGELGNNASSAQLQVNVTITRSTDAILTALNNRASRDGFTVAMAPVDFNITASYNNQVSTVNEFTTYVKRELPIPADYDPNRITTAVVVDAQGNIHHVPTAVAQQGNAYYAVVNSLTNSNYGLIWNPKEFPDVANHWSKSAVNDMASRLVVNGVDSTHFNPNSNVTRAEFAAILVRALGLSDTGTSSKFSDVSTSDWYMGAVTVANKYNLIDGYENGTFRPNQTISRQEAFVILNRAIAIVKLQQATGSTTTLSSYSDQRKVATWAQTATQAVLSSGVVQGNGKLLNPTGQMSRAETATVMQRLLKLAKLI